MKHLVVGERSDRCTVTAIRRDANTCGIGHRIQRGDRRAMIRHRRDADRETEAIDDGTVGDGEPIGPHRGSEALTDLATFLTRVSGEQQHESAVGLRENEIVSTEQRDEEASDARRDAFRRARSRLLGERVVLIQLGNEQRGVPNGHPAVQD